MTDDSASAGGAAPHARLRGERAVTLVWSAGNLLLAGFVAWTWLTPLPYDGRPAATPAPTATDIPLELVTSTPGFALTATPRSSATFTPTPGHSGGGGAQPTATLIPPTPTPKPTATPTATPIPPTPTERPTPNPQS